MSYSISDYNNSLDLLKERLNNSIVNFGLNVSDNLNDIEISCPKKSESLMKYYKLELDKIGFETGFYKFVINDRIDIDNLYHRYLYKKSNDIEDSDYKIEYNKLKSNLCRIVNKAKSNKLI